IMRIPVAFAAAASLAAALAGCGPFPEPPHEQPGLTTLVPPFAALLAAEGGSRIEVPGAAGAYLRVGTPYGYFEIRDQGDVPPAPFVVVSDDSARVLSDSYAPSDLKKYRAAIDRIVPGVLRVAPRYEAEIHQ